ncbi:MAG: PhnD/SsuA/transferrin family substrate-binding protein, partial [Planctomycetota bacterium]
MDPLCAALACDCVEGYAQRNYGLLGSFLGRQTGRPVEVLYGENLRDVLRLHPGDVDLIIGKSSVVMSDAARAKERIRPIARLTDEGGSTDQFGLFVVRSGDAAKAIADLGTHRILLGPASDDEKHKAALEALADHGVTWVDASKTAASCSTGALAVVEGDADATVISSYALTLLEGCGTIDKGMLRVVGRTRPVAFVTVFATDRVPPVAQRAIVKALLSVRDNAPLLEAMDSKAGFVTT